MPYSRCNRERAKKKGPLTSKVKLVQGRVILQSLGQHLRILVPDIVTFATSQANDSHGVVRESCSIRSVEGRGRREGLLSHPRPSSFRVELFFRASANTFAPSTPKMLPLQHHKRMIFMVTLEKVVLFDMQKGEGEEEGSPHLQG